MSRSPTGQKGGRGSFGAEPFSESIHSPVCTKNIVLKDHVDNRYSPKNPNSKAFEVGSLSRRLPP